MYNNIIIMYSVTENRGKESQKEVCLTKVPSPIKDVNGDGDGPVYDNIKPQYEILVAVPPTSTIPKQEAPTVTKTSQSKDVSHYADPPLQPPQLVS